MKEITVRIGGRVCYKNAANCFDVTSKQFWALNHSNINITSFVGSYNLAWILVAGVNGAILLCSPYADSVSYLAIPVSLLSFDYNLFAHH